ncbi:uncharacterized protein [Littorina saxatilis]|uniref:uncharacterized protein n=1 Tax=Littorina saxatilis TaxID=31220 RepID=UPI0038B430BE
MKFGNNIYWSVTVNGHQTRISDCRQCFGNSNCPPCFVSNSFLYKVERFHDRSTLRLLDNVQNLNGATVVCSSFSNNSQARCDLNVVKEFGVGACQQGYIDVEEDRNTTLGCENLNPSWDVKWNLNSIVNGGGTQIASCLKCGTCPMKCTIRFPRFIAERTNTTSKLVVVNPRREDGGKMMQCANGNTIIDECKIRVVRKAELHNASVSWHNTWNVTGTVSFNNLYTSDNNTICRWYTTNQGQTTRLSTAPTELSTYLDNGKLFFRGKCDAEIELMTSDGAHLISVEMIPGHGPIFAGTIHTAAPGNLTALNNTCPAYVAEGRDVRCQCGHLLAQQGSPPAHVSWEHDMVSPVLELDNVRRQQSGKLYRCHSVWGAGKEINTYYNYTLQVAYGPTNAVINITHTSDPAQNTTLTCTSDDVFPSANFSWSVTCVTETLTRQSSACIVTPEVITNETEVVCVVSNSEIPDLHSTEVFKFRDGNDNQAGQDNPGGVAIVAGGAVGVVVVIAVIAVLLVVCVRRNRKQPEQQELTERRVTNSGEEFEECINEFYESSDGIEAFRDKNQTSAADPLPLNINGGASHDNAVVYSNSAGPLPSDHRGDVYAQVVKTTKKTTQDDVDSERQGQDTYAQVQTKPKGDKGQHQSKGDNSKDVYMNTSR